VQALICLNDGFTIKARKGEAGSSSNRNRAGLSCREGHIALSICLRFTRGDYARAMTFVAFDEVSNDSDSIYESDEYAILLRSDLKGRGLGWP
jgi:hypothetical protein